MVSRQDTIAAIATPTGQGGIGVVRISGPKSLEIAQLITRKSPAPRIADYAAFKDKNDDLIDRGLVIYFPAPRSFTGEDIVELHGHGGRVVLNRLLTAIVECGARLARPGEFSERAFLNDKIDLVQAEAIADLINSASEQAARSAMRSLEGEFSSRVTGIRDEIINLRVFVEGAMDFPDEDINFLADAGIHERAEKCLSEINSVLRQARAGRVLNEGISVVIVGPPNVGKSSLLNRLVQRERAIVSDVPGTTRDVIEDVILIAGVSVNILDTAGIHDSEDVVEAEGIRRTFEQIDNADVVVLVREHGQELDAIRLHTALQEKQVIQVENKIDLHGASAFTSQGEGVPVVGLSAKTGEGLELLQGLMQQLTMKTSAGEDPVLARSRHVKALSEASDHLQKGLENIVDGSAIELFAQDLHQAQMRLGEITGTYTADDLLGEIFSRFCIGK